VQFSVFEIEVDPAQWTKLRARLEGLIDPTQDSLRNYYLGANWRRRVEHVGAKPTVYSRATETDAMQGQGADGCRGSPRRHQHRAFTRVAIAWPFASRMA
jgi:hypothetical protein